MMAVKHDTWFSFIIKDITEDQENDILESIALILKSKFLIMNGGFEHIEYDNHYNLKENDFEN